MTAIPLCSAHHSPERSASCYRPRSQRDQMAGIAARMMVTVREWRRRSRGRAELASLDDRMLADIGITRAEAWYQAGKPFWRK